MPTLSTFDANAALAGGALKMNVPVRALTGTWGDERGAHPWVLGDYLDGSRAAVTRQLYACISRYKPVDRLSSEAARRAGPPSSRPRTLASNARFGLLWAGFAWPFFWPGVVMMLTYLDH